MQLWQLLEAYRAFQRDRWDHTCAMISSWTGKPCRNPYRQPKRQYMSTTELYAIQAAVEARRQQQ